MDIKQGRNVGGQGATAPGATFKGRKIGVWGRKVRVSSSKKFQLKRGRGPGVNAEKTRQVYNLAQIILYI